MYENLYRPTNKGMAIKNNMITYLQDNIYHHEKPYNYFVTLASNWECKELIFQNKVIHWSNNIKSRLFRAKEYQDRSKTDTSKYLNCFRFTGFLEKTKAEQYPHFHLLMYITPKKIDKFKEITLKQWNKLLPKGSCDIQNIYGNEDHLIEYVTKDLDKPVFYNHVVVG